VDQAIAIIQQHKGEPVEILLRREGKALDPVTVTPRVDATPEQGAVGVSLGDPWTRKSYPVWRAVPLGIRAAINSVRGMFYMIWAAIQGQVPFQVTGPIGIARETARVAKTSLEQLIEFTAFLSINLFLVNLLPLPALDGGRLIFVLIEWVRGGKRVPPEKEGLVHAIGMVVLIMLMVVVTFMDYMRYFGT
jgi:regulator of sigma E protease